MCKNKRKTGVTIIDLLDEQENINKKEQFLYEKMVKSYRWYKPWTWFSGFWD